MDWSALTPVIVALLTGLVGVFLNWLRKWLEERGIESDNIDMLYTFIEGWGQRGRDKFLAELAASKDPDSDGGVNITAEEFSAIRQSVYDDLMKDLPEELQDMATTLGPDVIKGLLGKYIGNPLKEED